MNGSLRYALLTAVPVLLILIAGAVLNPKKSYWGEPELPRAQCEAFNTDRLHALPEATAEVYDQKKLNRLVREPLNTVSSLAYAIAGLAIMLASYQPASRALGAASIGFGLGSGFYHATLLPELSIVDMIGVYAVLYCLVLCGAAASIEWLKRRPVQWGLAGAMWLLAFYTGIWRNDRGSSGTAWFDSTDVFAVAVAAIGLLVYAVRRKAKDRKRYLWSVRILIGAAVVALVGLIGDRFGGFWATPDAPVQGHALWHVFGAAAIVGAYEALVTTGFDHSTLRRKQFAAKVIE
jgi:hypothetical protein